MVHANRNKAYFNRRNAERRAFLRKVKDVPCADCGKVFHHAAMEFDHLPGTEKCFIISQRYLMVNLEKLKAEIAKCVIVCSNCHHIRTWVRSQSEIPDAI